MSREADRIRRLEELDQGHIWHPFTPMADWMAESPLIIESGDGAILRDVRGTEFVDGVSSLWCAALGHRRAEIDQAVREQLDRIAHTTLLGLASPPSIELAARLVRMAPVGLEKVFFSDNGSTAAEAAMKMAFQYWQQNGQPGRKRIGALQNAYHGDTMGAVSAGGIGLFHETYRPLLFEAVRVPSPSCYRCPWGVSNVPPRSTGVPPVVPSCGQNAGSAENSDMGGTPMLRCSMACLVEARKTILEHGPELAAVIVEPMMQGAAGMLAMPEGYLKGVEAACREAGTFLIADEVATGFGRTGKMFACEWEGVRPDFLVLGKALTGGYLPVAATLTTREVFDGFIGPGRTFYHGHTFTGNALGCAAANAALDAMAAEGIPEALGPAIQRFREGLDKLAELPHVGDVRQLGMMAGAELVLDRAARAPFDPALRAGAAVCKAMRQRGAILRPLGDVLIFMPPLTIPLGLLDKLMEAAYWATAETTARFASLS